MLCSNHRHQYHGECASRTIPCEMESSCGRRGGGSWKIAQEGRRVQRALQSLFWCCAVRANSWSCKAFSLEICKVSTVLTVNRSDYCNNNRKDLEYAEMIIHDDADNSMQERLTIWICWWQNCVHIVRARGGVFKNDPPSPPAAASILLGIFFYPRNGYSPFWCRITVRNSFKFIGIMIGDTAQ
jgi:hypothetical protein